MVRFSGPCKTIPVRHSGGPLVNPNPNPKLTLTLTPGMADPRNGGAGTCKTLNGAQRADVHRNLSKIT